MKQHCRAAFDLCRRAGEMSRDVWTPVPSSGGLRVCDRSQLLRNSLLAARRTSLLNAGIPVPNFRHQRLARVAGLAVRLAVLAVLARVF